jgi:alpha-amylase
LKERPALTDIVFVFEVHQPHRLRKNLFWENRTFQRVRKADLFSHYFDKETDREIFNRAARKAYFPSNQVILDAIDARKHSSKQAKFAFSLSGTFLEQCEMYNPDLLETFRQLSKSGCVEFLDQTYYHSLAGLYPNKDEFMRQVMMHRETVKSLLGYEPTMFENTELLYNDTVAKIVDNLGYKGIYTEGVERILGDKSPNYLYRPHGTHRLKLFLRNYKLTDDVGFRFSSRWWSEYPLTADKYAHWLADTKGDLINIFPDYETFGEHHWPETGIHGFLRVLPEEILKWPHLFMATPSEVAEKRHTAGEVSVPESEGTVSWADLERDSSGWLSNALQWAYYINLQRLEPLVHESDDPEFLRLWRCFQTSDHLYYMFSKGGAPGEVHSYFSPYESAAHAFVVAETSLLDFENRLRTSIITANEPFMFSTQFGKENLTGTVTWSLKGFLKALKTEKIRALEFHVERGDFASWVGLSLRDSFLADELNKIKASNVRGDELRNRLIGTVENRFNQLSQQTQFATRILP